MRLHGYGVNVLHIGVGFGVARFDIRALPEPQIVKRATVQDFTLFYAFTYPNTNPTVAVVLDRRL